MNAVQDLGPLERLLGWAENPPSCANRGHPLWVFGNIRYTRWGCQSPKGGTACRGMSGRSCRDARNSCLRCGWRASPLRKRASGEISRPTGYRWLEQAAKESGCGDRLRRPHTSPCRTGAELNARFVPQPGWLPLLLPGSEDQHQGPVLRLRVRDGDGPGLRAGVRQHELARAHRRERAAYQSSRGSGNVPGPHRVAGNEAIADRGWRTGVGGRGNDSRSTTDNFSCRLAVLPSPPVTPRAAAPFAVVLPIRHCVARGAS